MSEIVTTDLVDRLRERATVARDEGNATALGDALNFEGAAREIDRLRAVNAAMREALEATKRDFAKWAEIRGGVGTYAGAMTRIDAAIAKARGDQ